MNTQSEEESHGPGTDRPVRLALSWDELAFLISATRETLESVDEWEFQTRVGIDQVEAQQILNMLKERYNAEDPAPQT